MSKELASLQGEKEQTLSTYLESLPILSTESIRLEDLKNCDPKKKGIHELAPNIGGTADEIMKTLTNVQPSFFKKVGRFFLATLISLTVVGFFLWVLPRFRFIPKGKIGMCTDINGHVERYGAGVHLILSPYSHLEMYPINEPVIQHQDGDSIVCQIITVPAGQIGVGYKNGVPVILNAGKHLITETDFVYENMFSSAAPYVHAGNVHIINIQAGQIAHAIDQGKLIILKPGRHLFQSDTLHFNTGNIQSQTSDLINLSNVKQFLRVPENMARIVTAPHGQRFIAAQGFYILEGAQYKVDKQVVDLRISQIEIIVQTRTLDMVSVEVPAQVFFSIKNVNLTMASLINVEAHVKERAMGMLNGLVSGAAVRFTGVQQSIIPDSMPAPVVTTAQQAESSSAAESSVPTPPQYLDIVRMHDLFEGKFKEELDELGIELVQVAIAGVKILDPKVQEQLSEPAKRAAEEYAAQQVARVKQSTRLVEVETEARALTVKAKVQAEATQITARADAEASIIKARADAEAVLIQAEAEAKATRQKGEAEADADSKQYAALVQAGGVEALSMHLQGEALKGTKPTLFSNGPGSLPTLSLLTQQLANVVTNSHPTPPKLTVN